MADYHQRKIHMIDALKHELKHLELKVSELRAKINALINDPNRKEEISVLNSQMDDIVNLVNSTKYQIESYNPLNKND
jgi:uncharacterized protein Yka (UPF0111/DUF47 family)